MGRKQKVIFETKIKYMDLFLNNQIRVAEIVETLNISRRTFTEWIRKYNNGGINVLNTVGEKFFYSQEIKENAVNDYINDKGSLADVLKCRKTTYDERVAIVAFCIANN